MSKASDKIYFDQLVTGIAKAFEAAEIDPAEIGRLKNLGGYQQGYKDNDGQGHIVDLFKWQFSPTWEDGPAWPIVDQPAPVKIARVKPPKNKAQTGLETVLFVPDLQAGFFILESGEQVPMHDPRCLDLFIQVAAKTRPDRVVYLGDNLDLAEWSLKFARAPTMAGSLSKTLEVLYRFHAMMRAVTGDDCRHDYLEGNHEKRLPLFVAANAEAAFGVKRPGDDWPVLSVPYLLRLEELDVTWHGGYPQGTVWLRDDIRAVHGKRLSAERASKDPIIVSQFQGHTHRLGVKSRTHTGHRGAPIHTLHVECGTGARIDGAVPSFGSATDDKGAPVIGNESEDWQQGCVLATFDPESIGVPSVELVPIVDGSCLLRGELLKAEVSP